MLFWTKIGSFTDSVFKNYISAQLNLYQKYMLCILLNIYHSFKYLFGISLCSMLTCLLNAQILAQNDIFFFYFGLFWRLFYVTIATVKVHSIRNTVTVTCTCKSMSTVTLFLL